MAHKVAPPLSAEWWNPLIEETAQWALEMRDSLLREFYASGHPPGTNKRSPAEIYQTLAAMKQAGSLDYWQSPQAQAELDKLAKKYGPVAAVAPPMPPEGPPLSG